MAFLALEPNDITALNYAGYLSEKLNDYAEAAQYYEKVLSMSADNLYALNHLGLAYKQLQRLDEAVTVLRQALSLDPKCKRPESENLHNYLGLIYLEQRRSRGSHRGTARINSVVPNGYLGKATPRSNLRRPSALL